MARHKKTVEVDESYSPSEDVLDKALNGLDDINPDADFLSEHTLSNVTDWIDTGCYALNAIMSGSLFKGVPVGRITGFYGPQAVGKTLILNKIMANAMKKGYKPVYFDSENALDDATAARLGCDISKVKHAPVETIESLKHQMVTLLTKLIEINAKRKVILFVDSLGNLSTQKEIDDALKGSTSSDMGSKAKAMSSLLRTITNRAAKAEVPIIFTNHIYENPGQMYPTLIKQQAGGLKPLFLASLLVQLSTTTEKTDETIGEVNPLSQKVSGVFVRALTAKNRFAPPFIETKMYLNFKTGLSKYYGLLDLAVACGTVIFEGKTYTLPTGEKLGYASAFENKEEFWNNERLKELDAAVQSKLVFSSEPQEII